MEDKFKLEAKEEFMWDLYSNHAMNALAIKQVTGGNQYFLAKEACDIADAMIIERRKRKAL